MLLDVRGRYFRLSVAKVVFEDRNDCSHREFCGSGCFGEKRECLQKRLPRGEVAWCRSGILHRSRHSQFWG